MSRRSASTMKSWRRSFGLLLAKLVERHGRGLLAAEARNPRVHDAARRAGRIIHEPPHLRFGAPRQQCEAAVARFLGDPRQRDREHAGIERVQRLLQQLLGQRGHDLVDARRREVPPDVRERVGLVPGEQLHRGRAPEAVDDVGGLRRVLEQELAVDPVERERARRRRPCPVTVRRSVPIRSPMLRHTLPAPIAMSSVTSAISRSPFGSAT